MDKITRCPVCKGILTEDSHTMRSPGGPEYCAGRCWENVGQFRAVEDMQSQGIGNRE